MVAVVCTRSLAKPQALKQSTVDGCPAKWTKAQLVRSTKDSKYRPSTGRTQPRGSSQQKARLEVLPAEDATLPHRPVPPVDYEKLRPDAKRWWCPPAPDPRASTSSKKLSAVEEPAEDPLGHRPGGNQEAPRPGPGRRSHQDRGAIRGRAVQPGDPRFRRDNRRRQDGWPTEGKKA